MFDLSVTFISVIVIAVVLLLVIGKLAKAGKARKRSKTTEPTPLIDKSEIDLNGLYLKKMEIVGKKKFLGEQQQTKGGNGRETYHP
jgi:predicted membrane protein